MRIIIAGNFKKIPQAFSSLNNSRLYDIELVQPEEYRAALKKEAESPPSPVLVYLETEAFCTAEIKKECRFLLKKDGVSIGILDTKNKIEDPASLFHMGVSDYLGKKICSEPVQGKRIKQLLEFSKKDSTPTSPIPINEDQTKAPTGKSEDQISPRAQLVPDGDWSKLKKGSSYIFCFMFIELDLTTDWKKKAGPTHLKKVKTAFQNYVQNAVNPINGKIWMWNEYGGLVLFPYVDGPCAMVLESTKLMVNRAMASCEKFHFKTSISYRIGLHIGETVYQEKGNTGTIISDTVNFIFHLGQKFARPGNLYITKPVYELTYKGLKDLFLEDSDFEGRKIYRMREIL
ncbi:MAG: hypothetical protein JEY99_07195 [Spirochaetales bacterium]|nr:hypothetical protein [Spirochaetales bacterium]